MCIFRDQRGQTTIPIALCLLCLCGMTGFAVDAGMMFRAKRHLQIAVAYASQGLPCMAFTAIALGEPPAGRIVNKVGAPLRSMVRITETSPE